MLKDMLDRFDNMTIINRLFEIYPDQGKNGDGYVKALDIWRGMTPKLSKMVIRPSKWHTGGKMPNDDTNWGLTFVPWEEWLGMKVFNKRDSLTTLCHILYELTWHGYTPKENQKLLKELNKRMADIQKDIDDKEKNN